MNEIEKFIERFKSPNPSVIEDLFLNVHCYYFALILQHRYPEVDIMIDMTDDHIVVRDQNNIYDIRGNITDLYDEDHMDELIELDELENEDYEEYCIVKESCIDLK